MVKTGNGNLSEEMIMDKIRNLNIQMIEYQKQLETFRQEKFKEALDIFLKKFGIYTIKDINRVDKLLEDIEDIAKSHHGGANVTIPINEESTACGGTLPFTPVPSAPVEGKADSSHIPPVDDIGKFVYSPFEGGPESNPESNEMTSSVPTTNNEAAVSDKKSNLAEELHFDWESLADETLDQPGAEDISGFSKAVSDPEPSFRTVQNDTESEQKNSDTLWASLETEFGMAGIEAIPDDSIIDVAAVISSIPEDPILAKYKDRPAVRNAETVLVEAIAAAVEEGWVAKKDIGNKFFASCYEIEDGDLYAKAQKVCDSLSSVWGQAGGKSDSKLQEFMAFPYHIRCKAVALAANALKYNT